MTRIPPMFLSHGSPDLYFKKSAEGHQFLKNLGQKLKEEYPIKAIVCVSAHWENSVIHVNTSPNPQQIYDFYGFPDHLYEFKYPVKGSTEVARRVIQLLQENSIECKENLQGSEPSASYS